MATTQQGALRLFRFAGINVFVHWTWLLVAWFEMTYRNRDYLRRSGTLSNTCRSLPS